MSLRNQNGSSEQFEVSAHFNKTLADTYEKRIRLFCPNYDALHAMIASLLTDLPERANFLSAGAGTGTEILMLGRLFPDWHFHAVDNSAEMLNVCHGRVAQAGMNERVTYFHGRMQEFMGDPAFDAASSVFVSHFIKGREEKLSYFNSIASHLKPGGLFVLADLFGDRDLPEFSQLLEAQLASYASHGITAEEFAKDRAHVENDIDYVPEAELADYFDEAGFTTPVRFYQTYLFGGWIARRLPKRNSAD